MECFGKRHIGGFTLPMIRLHSQEFERQVATLAESSNSIQSEARALGSGTSEVLAETDAVDQRGTRLPTERNRPVVSVRESMAARGLIKVCSRSELQDWQVAARGNLPLVLHLASQYVLSRRRQKLGRRIGCTAPIRSEALRFRPPPLT